jgi:hypothetical protein
VIDISCRESVQRKGVGVGGGERDGDSSEEERGTRG